MPNIDTALTNIFAITGVAQIRYRVYLDKCLQSSILHTLKHNHISAEYNQQSALLLAYRDLVRSGIPCTWRIDNRRKAGGENDRDDRTLTLQLWVFWFDDRHTTIIDRNEKLQQLREFKVGCFTSEDLKASKKRTSEDGRYPKSLTVSNEYKLFLTSVNNILRRVLLDLGAIPLGNFFLLHHVLPDDNARVSLDDIPPRHTIPYPITTVACSYNAYLAGSVLVFQPVPCALRVRTLAPADLRRQGLKVYLGPTGEQAYLVSMQPEVSALMTERLLLDWSLVLGIPVAHLKHHNGRSIPLLVGVRTKSASAFLYPSALVFLPTSIRHYPKADGSYVNGAHMRNSFWTRQQHQNMPEDNGCSSTVDYPESNILNKIFDALMMESDIAQQQQQEILQTMLQQPVLSSPLMRPKSVGTPSSLTKSSRSIEDEQSDLNNAWPSSNMSLREFAFANFSLHPSHEQSPEHEKSFATRELLTGDQKMPRLRAQADTQYYYGGSEVDDDAYRLMPSISKGRQCFERINEEDRVLYSMEGQWSTDAMIISSEQLSRTAAFNNESEDFEMAVTEADFDFFDDKPAIANNNAVGPVPSSLDEPSTSSAKCAVEKDAFFIPTKGGLSILSDEDVQSFVVQQQQHEDLSLSDEKRTSVTEKADLGGGSSQAPDNIIVEVAHSQKEPLSNDLVLFDVSDADPGTETRLRDPIPYSFRPVDLRFTVDYTKYIHGGKFVYDGIESEDPLDITEQRYRPDYVPNFLLRKTSSSKELDPPDTDMSDYDMELEDGATDGDGSSSSSISGDEDEDDDLISALARRYGDYFVRIEKAQQVLYIDRLLGVVENHPKRRRLVDIELDLGNSPFSGSIADTIAPTKWDSSSTENYASLDYLCQQAVWGGYPFAGEPLRVDDNDDNVENTEAVIARHRTLLQSFRGDITHVDCIPARATTVIHSFKRVLETAFMGCAGQILTHDNYLSSVRVRGPLTVQQYSVLAVPPRIDFSATRGRRQNTHLESSQLELLSVPDIAVGREGEHVEGSAAMVRVWEKLNLEPCICKKQILYFVVYPDNVGMRLSSFMSELSTVYDTCQLGTHCPGDAEPYSNGRVPVPLIASLSWQESYMTVCENLGFALSQMLASSFCQEFTHIVVYFGNPSTRLSSALDLSQCFQKLVSKCFSCPKNRKISYNQLVMQIIPLEQVVGSNKQGYTMCGLRDIAFSVYSRCHSSPIHPLPEKSPPWFLPDRLPEKIRFSLKEPILIRAAVICNPGTTIHVAYTYSLDRRWFIAVWVDAQGKSIDFTVLEHPMPTTGKQQQQTFSPLFRVFSEAWKRIRSSAQRVNRFCWFVIAKMGLMLEGELQAWLDVLQMAGDMERVSILCMDMDSPLYAESLSITSEQSTEAPNSSPSSETSVVDTERNDPSMLLIMLDHPVPYCRKRVNTYQGNLDFASVSDLTNWIMPLATGYLLRPAQGECSLVAAVEVHLLYTQRSQIPHKLLHHIIRQYHDLSYICHSPPSNHMQLLLPAHFALVERLCRILLVVAS